MLDINVEEVASTINSKVSSANAKVHKPVEDGAGDSSVEVSADSIHEVASALKEMVLMSFKLSLVLIIQNTLK
jgi:hypothetical protein